MAAGNGTVVERLTRLETIVEEMSKQQAETNEKLDELLTIKNKGVGAFWLASAVLGTGIMSLIAEITGWFKGIHM